MTEMPPNVIMNSAAIIFIKSGADTFFKESIPLLISIVPAAMLFAAVSPKKEKSVFVITENISMYPKTISNVLKQDENVSAMHFAVSPIYGPGSCVFMTCGVDGKVFLNKIPVIIADKIWGI